MTSAHNTTYGTSGYKSVALYITSPLDAFTLHAQAFGPVTAENVFDYFTESRYYDKQSNNQVLRMQTQHTGVPLVNEAEELRCVFIDFNTLDNSPIII